MVQISRLILLVHPFYSFLREAQFLDEMDVKSSVQQMKVISGLWGQRLKEAAKDKEAAVIILKRTGFAEYNAGRLNIDRRTKLGLAILEKQLAFAERILGNRLIMLGSKIPERGLLEIFRERGLQIDKRALGGRAFGEWFSECVNEEKARLAQALGIKNIKIGIERGLSLEPWQLQKKEKIKRRARRK